MIAAILSTYRDRSLAEILHALDVVVGNCGLNAFCNASAYQVDAHTYVVDDEDNEGTLSVLRHDGEEFAPDAVFSGSPAEVASFLRSLQP